MKKTYIKPKIKAVVNIRPRLMLSGSNTVNYYVDDTDIVIGDSDS